MLRACSHVATAPISIRPLSRGCYSTLGRWRFLGLATFATLVWLYRCSRNVCLAGIRAHGRCLSSRLRRGTVDSSPCVVARNRPRLGFASLRRWVRPRAHSSIPVYSVFGKCSLDFRFELALRVCSLLHDWISLLGASSPLSLS